MSVYTLCYSARLDSSSVGLSVRLWRWGMFFTHVGILRK